MGLKIYKENQPDSLPVTIAAVAGNRPMYPGVVGPHSNQHAKPPLKV